MRVPAADLKAQFATIEEDVRAAIERVLQSQHFILGPEVEALERELCEYLGCRHAVGVSSGTDALLVALMALEIGPGDEVITSPYTFFATGGVIQRLGATPVFVDVEPSTYNIDPALIPAAITDRTRAIIPVHLFGRCAEMEPILATAREHGIPVIEDSAQSIGARYGERAAGTLGAMGCYSFFPAKNLGAFGDAGLVVTDDDDLAERLRILRVHGGKPKYHHHVVGGNFRLDAIQAAVLRAKLPHLDSWSQRRREIASTYEELFAANASTTATGPLLARPRLEPLQDQVFNQYVVRAHRRDALQASLQEKGVATAIYYPIPLHLQACFASLGHHPGDLPVAERAANESLALPVHAELSRTQVEIVVREIQGFFGESAEETS